MKSYRSLFLVLCVTAATGLSAQKQSQGNPNFANAHIQVQVRLPNGRMAGQGIGVTLEREDSGFAGQSQTDSMGKASFRPGSPGVFVVTVKQPGFLEASQRVDLTLQPTALVSIELRPKPGTNDAVVVRGTAATIPAVPEPALKEFQAGQKSLQEKHDAAGSIRHFQKAIALYKDFSEAYLMLGMVYLDQNKLADAESALQRSSELAPDSAASYFGLGACWNQEKKYPAAEKALSRGLELNPDAFEGHYELAKTLLALGRWQEAEPHAQKAAAAMPNLAPVHVVLGNIALRKNDSQEALREFQEYLRLDPHGPMADGVRAISEKIRKVAGTSR